MLLYSYSSGQKNLEMIQADVVEELLGSLVVQHPTHYCMPGGVEELGPSAETSCTASTQKGQTRPVWVSI